MVDEGTAPEVEDAADSKPETPAGGDKAPAGATEEAKPDPEASKLATNDRKSFSTSKSKCVTDEAKSAIDAKSATEAKDGSSQKLRKSSTVPKSEEEKSKSTRASTAEPRKSIPERKPSGEIKNHTSGTPVEAKSSIDKHRPSKLKPDSKIDSKGNVVESLDSKLSIPTSKDTSKDIFSRRKSSRSIGKAIGSIISFRRGSIAEYFDRQKTAKYMNTYKLDSEKPFNVDRVEKILKEVLIEALDNLTYDADKVPKQAKWASSVIRTKVKEQEFDRYKLICNVTIGEKRSQDMFATYRFLWDAERDKHASYVHENMYLFAVAVCFGIYYE